MAHTSMSLTASATASALSPDPSVAISLKPLTLASMFLLGTVPWWREALKGVSDVAAELGPLIALTIGLVSLWQASRGTPEERTLGSKTKSVRELAHSAASKGGPIALAAAVLFAVGAVLFATRDKAQAAPLPTPTAAARRRKSDDAAGDDGDAEDELLPVEGSPRWFNMLWSLRGLHEGTKRSPNPTVIKMYEAAGHPGVTDTTGIPWCAAAVAYAFKVAGVTPRHTLSARDWLNWGMPLDKPRVGCVVVMWRGSPKGWQGHVGLYVREDDEYIYVLGGNQSDSVSVARFRKRRGYGGKMHNAVLGYRWPKAPKPLHKSTINAGAAGAAVSGLTAAGASVATAVADKPPPPAAPDISAIEPVTGGLRDMAAVLPWAGAAAGALTVAFALFVMWRRYRHRQETET